MAQKNVDKFVLEVLRALRASIVFFVCLRSLLLMYLRDFFFQEKVKNFSRSVLIFRDLNCDFF